MNDPAEAVRQRAGRHAESPAFLVPVPDVDVSLYWAPGHTRNRCVISRVRPGVLIGWSGRRWGELADRRNAAGFVAPSSARDRRDGEPA